MPPPFSLPQIKTKGERKINFEQFIQGLLLVAREKASGREGTEPAARSRRRSPPHLPSLQAEPLDVMISRVMQLEGPSVKATVPAAVKLHDDRSTYTGVYKQGGPTNVDPNLADLRNVTNRAPADVRGVPLDAVDRPTSSQSSRARQQQQQAAEEEADAESTAAEAAMYEEMVRQGLEHGARIGSGAFSTKQRACRPYGTRSPR